MLCEVKVTLTHVFLEINLKLVVVNHVAQEPLLRWGNGVWALLLHIPTSNGTPRDALGTAELLRGRVSWWTPRSAVHLPGSRCLSEWKEVLTCQSPESLLGMEQHFQTPTCYFSLGYISSYISILSIYGERDINRDSLCVFRLATSKWSNFREKLCS